MKICYWGTYDRDYPRNITVIAGLRAGGAAVTECHEPLWGGTGEKLSRASSGWLAPGLLLRWLTAYLKLAFRFLRGEKPDFIFVGYSGHFDMFPAALLGRLRGVPVVFDAFLSLYEAFVLDRPAVKPGSLKANILFLVDKFSCSLADLVLLDTAAHIDYFCSAFDLPKWKFRRSFVGTTRVQPAAPPPANGAFTVLYFGRYIPLHGGKYIIQAAARLKPHKDILFRFDGSGEELEDSKKLALELGLDKAEFINSRDPLALAASIASADVCLGVFGDTPKAGRIIPNKVFEALALARPLVTGRCPAAEELLTDGKDCLLTPMASPEGIAGAVLRLKDDAALARKLAANGFELFRKKASAEVLGAEILEMLKPYLSEEKP